MSVQPLSDSSESEKDLLLFVSKVSNATALLDSQFKATGLEETLNDCLLLTEELNTITDLVEGDSTDSNKVGH